VTDRFPPWSPGSTTRNEGAAAGFTAPSLLPLAQAAGADERLAALLSAGALDANSRDETQLSLKTKLRKWPC